MMAQNQNVTAGGNTGGAEGTPRVPSRLIDVHDLCAILKCSPRHAWRMADAGKMQRPYKLGALCRWDRAAVDKWIAEGCPSCREGRHVGG